MAAPKPSAALELAARSAGLSTQSARTLAMGAALHESGLHWEAHEAWEEAWLYEEGDVKLLFQGLIQMAAACHKAWVQRQAVGCLKLLEAAREKLEPLPDGFGGLLLTPLLVELRALQAVAAAWLNGGAAPARASAPRLRPVANA